MARISRGQTERVSIVFNNDGLRHKIESYLIEIPRDGVVAKTRPFIPEQLTVPIIQQTLDEVLQAIKKFKAENPREASMLGL